MIVIAAAMASNTSKLCYSKKRLLRPQTHQTFYITAVSHAVYMPRPTRSIGTVGIYDIGFIDIYIILYRNVQAVISTLEV